MFRNITIFFVLCFAALPAFAQSPTPPATYAIGFNVDLLPTILSATENEFGYSVQGWIGRNHLRLRFVGAHLIMPNSMIGNDQFLNLRNNVGAVICDYTTGDNFDKWWIGSGLELWRQRIEHKSIAVTAGGIPSALDDMPESDGSAEWSNVVFTLGGGYIWKFYRNFYVDPWVAGHYILDPKRISVNRSHYEAKRFQAEASLKLGWNFDL
jgi:hypothetical protein